MMKDNAGRIDAPPLWVEKHLDDILCKKFFMPKEEWNRLARDEVDLLDKFAELVCSGGMDYAHAERAVYGDKSKYYEAAEKEIEKQIRGLEKETEIRKEEAKREAVLKAEGFPSRNYYPESELTQKLKDKLITSGYKRLKTSPFGDTGAAYYFVRPRYNESKEHAFFCYLIEDELKKRGIEPEMYINDGPDVVFERGKETCCIDVETGKNLEKNRAKVEKKFSRYARDYSRSLIFVTNKKLKHKYKKYGEVVTRASLRKALNGTLR